MLRCVVEGVAAVAGKREKSGESGDGDILSVCHEFENLRRFFRG